MLNTIKAKLASWYQTVSDNLFYTKEYVKGVYNDAAGSQIVNTIKRKSFGLYQLSKDKLVAAKTFVKDTYNEKVAPAGRSAMDYVSSMLLKPVNWANKAVSGITKATKMLYVAVAMMVAGFLALIYATFTMMKYNAKKDVPVAKEGNTNNVVNKNATVAEQVNQPVADNSKTPDIQPVVSEVTSQIKKSTAVYDTIPSQPVASEVKQKSEQSTVIVDQIPVSQPVDVNANGNKSKAAVNQFAATPATSHSLHSFHADNARTRHAKGQRRPIADVKASIRNGTAAEDLARWKMQR
jgi:hypothetical protein